MSMTMCYLGVGSDISGVTACFPLNSLVTGQDKSLQTSYLLISSGKSEVEGNLPVKANTGCPTNEEHTLLGCIGKSALLGAGNSTHKKPLF